MSASYELRKPPHPLAGAFERVKRAEEHLADLRRWFDGFRQESENATAASFDPSNPNTCAVNVPMMMPPLRSSVLVDEICYNLRGALDYLVYELALLDSQTIQNGTQFPIEDVKERFDGNAERFIKGVNARHRASLEDLQPYKGCL